MGKPVGKDSAKAARTAANRQRRIEREAQRQAVNAALRPARLRLRKAGALRRINRRLAAAIAGNNPTDALLATQKKCAAALSTMDAR